MLAVITGLAGSVQRGFPVRVKRSAVNSSVTARAITVDRSRRRRHNHGMELVLSLFPGIDLLGRAFQARGFCVVRGPDTLWDDPIEAWSCTVSPGKIDGIIAGPPCQNFSDANRFRNRDEGVRLLRECLRCIDESQPEWFLIENVRNVPDVAIAGYHVQRLGLLDCECGGFQRRLRHIQFGSKRGDIIRPLRTPLARSVTHRVVLCRPASPHDRPARRTRSQGFPGLCLRGLTAAARSRAIGNGVPRAIGESLAAAVSLRAPVTESDCVCLCGRRITARQSHATASCRKRMERRRRGTSANDIVTWP